MVIKNTFEYYRNETKIGQDGLAWVSNTIITQSKHFKDQWVAIFNWNILCNMLTGEKHHPVCFDDASYTWAKPKITLLQLGLNQAYILNLSLWRFYNYK